MLEQSIQPGQQVTAGELAQKAQRLLDEYEITGEPTQLDSAKNLFVNLVRELGPHPFAPSVAGLAESYLLRYLSTGNIRDLADSFGLSAPTRYTRTLPPPQMIYVQGRALHLLHRRTGSRAQLDIAIEGLSQLHRPDSPPDPKCAAAYAEALLDRYRLFPAPETLDLILQVAGSGVAQSVACNACFGRALYQRALAAVEPLDTYEGAPAILQGLEDSARNAVKYLRSAVNALAKGSPILPLCLARLADALVLLSRFKNLQNQRAGLRQEALSAAQTACELISPRSPHRSAIHRSLAGVLRWSAPDSPALLENLELAARSGAETDLIEGLEAAFEWGMAEPLRASSYVESLLRSLYSQLTADGQLRMGLLQDSVNWIVKGEGGQGSREEWYRPTWMKHTAKWPSILAAEWARIGQAENAILAIEQRPMVVLDCGRAGDLKPPSRSKLIELSVRTPLVYLVAGEASGYALILAGPQHQQIVQLEGLTNAAISRLMRGQAQKDPDIEGLEYTLARVASPNDPLAAGLLSAYAGWQAGNGGEHNRELWFQPLDACGKWLGEVVLAPLERVLQTGEIVLIPTGQTLSLPLETAWLPDESRPSGRRYLCDSFLVRLAPSARVFLRTRELSSEPRFVGVGDPKSSGAGELPFAESEVHIAASCFPERELIEGAQATASNVSAALSRGNIVHLCCHAYSSFSRPFDSAIFLNADDRLYLWKLASIDFSHAELVILSACESAKVTRELTDQGASMSSALLGAGADAVIATAWSIDDPATAILMLRFYHGWKVKQYSAAEALRESRQWLRDTTNAEKAAFCESLLPELGGEQVLDTDGVGAIYRLLALKDSEERSYAHPHYWAAFSYFGA